MGDIELLRIFSLADEFKYMVVRDEEKVRAGTDEWVANYWLYHWLATLPPLLTLPCCTFCLSVRLSLPSLWSVCPSL
jgi:hypothetical protein